MRKIDVSLDVVSIEKNMLWRDRAPHNYNWLTSQSTSDGVLDRLDAKPYVACRLDITSHGCGWFQGSCHAKTSPIELREEAKYPSRFIKK